MKKITYYLSMLCIAFCASFFQQVSSDTSSTGALSTAQAPVTHQDQLPALTQNKIPLGRPIDYGPSTATRIIRFIFFLVFGVLSCREGVQPLHNIGILDGAQESWKTIVNIMLFLVGFAGIYLGFLSLLDISSIAFFNAGLYMPAHCLHRDFFGSLYYFFIPAAWAGLESIDFSQIAYVDMIITKEIMTTQDKTRGKKQVIWDVELQHTHRTGSQKTVFHRKLMIVLRDDRIYEIEENQCQGYSSFMKIADKLKEEKVPISVKRNY